MLKNLSRQESKFVNELVRWDQEESGRIRFLGHLSLALGSVVFVYTAFGVYNGNDPRLLGLGIFLLVFGAVAHGAIEAWTDRRHRIVRILLKLEPQLESWQRAERTGKSAF